VEEQFLCLEQMEVEDLLVCLALEELLSVVEPVGLEGLVLELGKVGGFGLELEEVGLLEVLLEQEVLVGPVELPLVGLEVIAEVGLVLEDLAWLGRKEQEVLVVLVELAEKEDLEEQVFLVVVEEEPHELELVEE
jgi:hypothetical protein